MTRLFLAIAVAVSVIASIPSDKGVSPLQKLDSMRASLRAVTRDASAASSDIAPLQTAMSRHDDLATQRAAVRLDRDARILCTQTGRTGNRLRQILGATRAAVVRRYINMLLRVMMLQWWEGTTLVTLSELVWHDPYVSLPNDVPRFFSLQINARWYAWQASREAVVANQFLVLHHRQFRFVRGPRN